MKFFRLLFSAVLALFLLVTCLDQSARAASKAKTPPAPPPDNRKLIRAVDAKAGTVTIRYMHDKTTVHIYKIDDLTQVKVNNQPGKLADIKVGMVVDDYLERDNDDLDAISLSGYGETKTAAKPKVAAKPKPKPPTTTTTAATTE